MAAPSQDLKPWMNSRCTHVPTTGTKRYCDECSRLRKNEQVRYNILYILNELFSENIFYNLWDLNPRLRYSRPMSYHYKGLRTLHFSLRQITCQYLFERKEIAVLLSAKAPIRKRALASLFALAILLDNSGGCLCGKILTNMFLYIYIYIYLYIFIFIFLYIFSHSRTLHCFLFSYLELINFLTYYRERRAAKKKENNHTSTTSSGKSTQSKLK